MPGATYTLLSALSAKDAWHASKALASMVWSASTSTSRATTRPLASRTVARTVPPPAESVMLRSRVTIFAMAAAPGATGALADGCSGPTLD